MTTTQSSILSLQPLNKTFGVVVKDIDLRTISDETFAALYQTWLEHALLVIPAQRFSDQQQAEFARRFGELVPGLEAVELSNVLPDGSLRRETDDDMVKILRGNMHWHQDNTYMPFQAKGAVLGAKVVPAIGGETAFADMRAAYDALEPDMQQQIENLAAHHSLIHSQKKIGEATKQTDSEYAGYGLDVEEVPLRPLVKIHPETGRRSLAAGRHAYAIPGLSESESDSLLETLNSESVNKEERVYYHRWNQGDVVVWDNRCLMHRACDWDFSEARVMLHSRIAGSPESETAL